MTYLPEHRERLGNRLASRLPGGWGQIMDPYIFHLNHTLAKHEIPPVPKRKGEYVFYPPRRADRPWSPLDRAVTIAAVTHYGTTAKQLAFILGVEPPVAKKFAYSLGLSFR